MNSRPFIAGTICVAMIVSPAFAQVAGAPPATTSVKTFQYGTKPATNPYAAAAGGAAAPATRPAVAFKPEELEQIAAPIALYPDSLLAQVFMASTYPLEVVQAERWVKANPSVKGDALAAALNKQTWDPSVKSLVDFPQVLTMMSEKLDWSMKLGDAFIADQKAIMDAVQRLRAKASAQGSLKTNEQQNVTIQNNIATTTQPASQVIVVESKNPDVVYVPTYNPTVVYGGWPYPSYPPAYYYPPGYVAGTALVSFGVGVAVGAAWGHAWGNCNWNGGDVDIDVDRNVNRNTNINRSEAKAKYNERNPNGRQGAGGQGGRNSFQHDPSHRGGVAYRDSATNAKYRGNSSQATAAARDSYRGRAETGRSDLARGGGTGSFSNNAGGAGRTNAGGTSGYNRSSAGTTGTRSSGFSGSGSSGSSARAESSRGQASRSASPSRSSSGGSRSSGGYSGGGGSRGGGGGSRGGGGRGGGGRR